MRRGTKPSAILAAARRDCDLVLLVQRRCELVGVERAGRNETTAARSSGFGEVQTVTPGSLPSPATSCVEFAGARLDRSAPDAVLKLQRLSERDHRRLVALAEALEGSREPDSAWIGTVDARPELRLRRAC